MPTLSPSPTENTTRFSVKIHRPRKSIAEKIIAFDVLRSLKNTSKSERELTSLLEVPNSTMRDWDGKRGVAISSELDEFLSSPCGVEFLDRILKAAGFVIKYGHGGIRSFQEFITLSNLDQYVASSYGALQMFFKKIEASTIAFGEEEEKRLAANIRAKKVTVGLDEMFRGKRPCLVAIEMVSNFIILEKFTNDRTAETWSREMDSRLAGLNIEIKQTVTDMCGALSSYAKNIGATHSPDLFHAQQELTKATAAPLASQERAFDKALEKDEAKVKKARKKYGEGSQQEKKAIGDRNLRKYGLDLRKQRREKVQAAKKTIGQIYHPVNLKTAKMQTADEIQKQVEDQVNIVKGAAQEAGLSENCMKRIDKASRTFEAMINFFKIFLMTIGLQIEALALDESQKNFFYDVLIPLVYLKIVIKRQGKEGRERLEKLIAMLENKVRDGPWCESIKDVWMLRAQEMAEWFQRSTGCVEGRNGSLSLLFHRFRRLEVDHLKACTVVHNYHLRRRDGTTAAERLFEQKHRSLFEYLVENVRIPGKPHHKEDRANLEMVV